ncbi:FAD-binding protein [Saccharopolyspora flava]|uniref:FAD binding domain-containing protein n=1 Tax=Saccharopolyspora flava TaxID=95161 RepID=A0A1I6NSW2_9PSEU|nr:FAD-binding protein [Saccharopolyspora flava]SFS30959.1 FAD binding domain-containing protein [Saccharopolyspora flava]
MHSGTTDLSTFPGLPGGGELVTDGDDLHASDLGNIVDRRPAAILRPRSTADVAVTAAWCARNGVPLRAHGTLHTTGGQALCPSGGVQVDMRSLNLIHAVTDEHADVEAGVLLRDVVWHAWLRGLRMTSGPTGYLQLSTGGVLSVGGISSVPAEGAIIDRVRAVEVVTPTGAVRWCTPQRNGSLFRAVLGGLGRAGIITRARLALTPVPPRARVYDANFSSLQAAVDTARVLVDRDEVDDVLIRWYAPHRDRYQLRFTAYHHPDLPPDDAHLVRGLDLAPQTWDISYWEFAISTDNRYDPFVTAGWNRVHKVWADYFLPDRALDGFLAATMPEITELDLSETSIGLLFPHRRSSFTRPGLRVPDDDVVWLFDVLSDGVGQTDPFWLPDRLRRNQRWRRRAESMGGTLYPIGTDLEPHAHELVLPQPERMAADDPCFR